MPSSESAGKISDTLASEDLPAAFAFLLPELFLPGDRRFQLVAEAPASMQGAPSVKGDTSAHETKPEEQGGIQDNSFLVEEAYNQEAGVVQHIFNWLHTRDHHAGTTRSADFAFTQEWPLGSQLHQFSYTLSFSSFFENPDWEPSRDEESFGDMLLNYRLQLTTEVNGRPAMAPRFSLILPTGDEHEGFGEGEVGYQLNLPVSKEVGHLALHGNAGLTIFPAVEHRLSDGGVSPHHDLVGYNLGASAIWIANSKLQPLVELVAIWSAEINDGGGVDRPFELILSPGFRYAPYTKGSTQIVVGAAVPIGLSEDAADIGMFLYLSVEHAFQKLSEDQAKALSGQKGDKSN